MSVRKTGIALATTAWLGLAAIAISACGTRTVGGDGPREPARSAAAGDDPVAEDDAEPSDPAPRQRALHVALELEDLMNVRDPSSAQTRVTLVATDETGSTDRRVLGVFGSVCSEAEVGSAEPGLPRSAIAGADCDGGARASRIRVVRDGDAIVALRAWIDASEDAPDDASERGAALPSYDEIERVELRPGAKVITGDRRPGSDQ